MLDTFPLDSFGSSWPLPRNSLGISITNFSAGSSLVRWSSMVFPGRCWQRMATSETSSWTTQRCDDSLSFVLPNIGLCMPMPCMVPWWTSQDVEMFTYRPVGLTQFGICLTIPSAYMPAMHSNCWYPETQHHWSFSIIFHIHIPSLRGVDYTALLVKLAIFAHFVAKFIWNSLKTSRVI